MAKYLAEDLVMADVTFRVLLPRNAASKAITSAPDAEIDAVRDCRNRVKPAHEAVRRLCA